MMDEYNFHGRIEIEVCTPGKDKDGKFITDLPLEIVEKAGHVENSGYFYTEGIRDASGPFSGKTIEGVKEWQEKTIKELRERFSEEQWSDISVNFWVEIDCFLFDLSVCGKFFECKGVTLDSNYELYDSSDEEEVVSIPIDDVKLIA